MTEGTDTFNETNWQPNCSVALKVSVPFVP
jgi:hypothetical protein